MGRLLRNLLAVSFVIAVMLQSAAFPIGCAAANEAETRVMASEPGSYAAYRQAHEDVRPAVTLTQTGADYIDKSDNFSAEPVYYGDTKSLVQTDDETGFAVYRFSISQSGYYTVMFTYAPNLSYKGNIELDLLTDGELPFAEAEGLSLPRIYADKSPIRPDANGHDMRPEVIETEQFYSSVLRDAQGYVKEALELYFQPGEHTVTVVSRGAPIVLKSIGLFGRQDTPHYQDYLAEQPDISSSELKPIPIQGEDIYYKTDHSLIALSDRTNAMTQPFDTGKIKLNYIGGSNWSRPGQKITYKFYVPAAGYYKLALRYRQNYLRGLSSSRRILLDEKLLFAEMENVEFPYGNDWDMQVLGQDGKPFALYLAEGEHTLSLECTGSLLAEQLQEIEQIVYDMNELYRRVIMITSTQPDVYRDYMLEKEIPGLGDELRRQMKLLQDSYAFFQQLSPEAGGEAAIMERAAEILEILVEYPEKMKEYLTDYKNNVSAIAAWLLSVQSQPLDLDYMQFLPMDEELPQYKPSFFDSFKTFWLSFFASFFEDYNTIGGSAGNEEAITVWTGWGRDQAALVKQLVDNDFTQKYGIRVNVQLVQSSLIDAILAGVGPDVALNIGRGQPVNLAMRGAAAELSAFDGFEEMKKDFSTDAFVPYSFNGGIYGVPNTQSFFMMFYRTDIFKELELEPPQTMDELYGVMGKLQRHNMEIALPYAQPNAQTLIDAGMGARNLFVNLLLQNGGSVYREDLTGTALDSQEATAAFRQWTEFYTKYKLPLYYDFFNRFRTGEMPLGIADYTMSNMLEVAAPEIRNFWSMVPVPGRLEDDGGINRAEGASGTACVILSGAKHKSSCFQFLKWWASTQTQAAFGTQIEAITGAGGRYPTANQKAFRQLPWKKAERESILQQWQDVREIEEIPGGYYTSRSIENAFADVYYNGVSPRDALSTHNDKTNEEILRKREEFGLTGRAR